MECWILTFEVNQYEQEGAYYLKVFKEKPSKGQVAEVLNRLGHGEFGDEYLDHVLSGGGRKEYEDIWFNLFAQKLA